MMSVNTEVQTFEADDNVRRVLMEVLRRKLSEARISVTGIDETTPLMDLGVIDSQGLLDLILEVEESSGRTFDPLRFDLESEVTLARIATAFDLES